MQKKLVNFKGLYGDHSQPFSGDFIHHELLETRSKIYNWDITEHLHTDLFQVFIIRAGNGLLLSENQKMVLETPCVLLVPNNTLHGFVFQSDIAGEVLTFPESFIEKIFQHSPHIILEINRLQQFSFKPTPEKFAEILLLKDKMEAEMDRQQPEKQTVLQLLFQILLIDLYRLHLVTEPRIVKSDNRTLDYFHSFQKNIRQSVHESKSICQYAKELNITPVHLNRICRSLVQKSALQVVHEHLINEAKKYLLETSYSISELSYFLDFKDPAHFSKLFKKYTGMTPGAFRGQKSL